MAFNTIPHYTHFILIVKMTEFISFILMQTYFSVLNVFIKSGINTIVIHLIWLAVNPLEAHMCTYLNTTAES